MSNKVDVSVVYVNYNTQVLLESSIRSLKLNLPNCNYEIIVVDNASKSFNKASLIKIHSSVKVIKLKQNVGFGKGNNAGAKIASGKYIWLLNTDTLIPKDNNLDILFNYLDNNTDCAAASPLLVNERGESQLGQIAKFPMVSRMISEKPLKLFFKILPFAKSKLKAIDPSYMPVSQCDVQQAVAASLVIRTTTFVIIGGFSKEYFMYYEDTDLCRKIASINKNIRFIPEAKVIHLHGRSISRNSIRKQMYYNSQDIYFKKWQSPFQILAMKALRLPLKLYHKVLS